MNNPELFLDDVKLNPCNKCGAEYCIPRKRRGPTILKYQRAKYRVVCLNCWKLGLMQSSRKSALIAWNNDIFKKAPSAFSEWLLKQRTDKDISRKKLADLSGVHPNTIYSIEKNIKKPKEETKRKLTLSLS